MAAAELQSLIKVTSYVAASMSYARFAASSTSPGLPRLLSLLPIITLLPILPFSFTSVHLRGISAFFLSWLAIFKLLLLSFNLPPLSPSLPLPSFIALSSLPLQQHSSSSSSSSTSSLILTTLIKSTLLAFIIPIYASKSKIHPYALLAIYSLHMYLALELVLSSAAIAARALLGLDLEPQFDAPYRSTSLQDFWGRRWNLMVTRILRPSVYHPVRSRWGTAAGTVAVFAVSGLMHEAMFYYLTLRPPTGEVSAFFFVHGVCTAAEVGAKRRWPGLRKVVPAAAATAVTLGFVAATAFWLFFPPILRGGTDEVVLAECAAVMEFLEEGGRSVFRWITG